VRLPDSVLAEVRVGELSSWAASRIVARAAVGKGSETVVRSLSECGHAVRERMVDHPRLLLRALEKRQVERGSATLRDGPEGAVASEIRLIEALIARLRRRLPSLQPVPAVLITAMPRVKAALAALDNAITWSITHDSSRDLFERARAEGAGPHPA
jgi:ParB family transcriptional regulator, chromosome partitioning protein